MKFRYWDSVVILGFLKEEPDKIDVCRQLLHEAQNGNFKIVTSAISLTEVVHLRHMQRLNPETESKIKAFFEHEFIIVRAVDRRTAEKARELMWRYHDQKLKHADAVHAATASLANVDVLNSYDDDLLNLHDQIPCENGNLLHIARPVVSQTKLFSDAPLSDKSSELN
jgi:predicted nucleic acid-binding protein